MAFGGMSNVIQLLHYLLILIKNEIINHLRVVTLFVCPDIQVKVLGTLLASVTRPIFQFYLDSLPLDKLLTDY